MKELWDENILRISVDYKCVYHHAKQFYSYYATNNVFIWHLLISVVLSTS